MTTQDQKPSNETEPPRIVTAADFECLRTAVPKESVQIPGVGPAEVWGFTGPDAEQYEKRLEREANQSIHHCVAIQMSLHAVDGTLIFQPGDILKIYQWPELIRMKLARLQQNVNGLGAGALVVEKNYATTLTNNSSSGS